MVLKKVCQLRKFHNFFKHSSSSLDWKVVEIRLSVSRGIRLFCKRMINQLDQHFETFRTRIIFLITKWVNIISHVNCENKNENENYFSISA